MDKIDIKNKLDSWIDSHEDEFIKDLSALIAIKSVKSEAREGMPFGEGSARAIEKAVEIFESYGFKCRNLENYAAFADLNDKKARLDILGHMDVVGEGDGWDTDPYTAVIKDDGCIYGRGTDDDKGPVIAAFYAMRAVKELGISLEGGVRLIIGGDEESGSEEDLKRYYSEYEPAPATFSPDANFPIYNTEKGTYRPTFTKKFTNNDAKCKVIRFDGGYRFNVLPAKACAEVVGIGKEDADAILLPLSKEFAVECTTECSDGILHVGVNGKAAHASTPDEGVNGLCALLAMLKELPLDDCDSTVAIRELSSLFPFGDNYGEAIGIKQSDEISGPLTLAFSILNFDESSLCGRFDSRVPVCANEENCKVVCEEILTALGYTVEGEMEAPHHTPADSDFVKTLIGAYEEYTGLKGECLYMGGGTYVHNIPGGVAFGAAMPDFQSNMHGANERANIKDLLCAAKIYAKVIVDMCL